MKKFLAVLLALAFVTTVSFADATKKAPAKSEVKKVDLIDINTASAQELASLTGIGDAFAKKIIAGRPYKGKDDLLKKKIIPAASYNKIQDKIIAKQK